MKKGAFLFLTFWLSVGVIHAQDLNTELLGKWTVQNIEINNVISAEKGQNPELKDTSTAKNQAFINAFAKGISDIYINSTFYFKANNKLKIKAKSKKIKGTYLYVKEDNTIVTNLENFKKMFVFKFENNTLTINRVDENTVIHFTLQKK